MSEPITYVGIDAHKRELHIAMLVDEASTPVTWTVRNVPRAIDRLRRKLERAAPGRIECCHEAGPCGYALQRRLQRDRLRCQVIAPAWCRASRAIGSRPTAAMPANWASCTAPGC